MSDKSLSEAGWKDLAKSRAKDLAPLLKLLAALGKAEREGPAAELEVLDEIEKEAANLRKANKGDKELGGRLDELGKALDKQRKTSQQALREQESSADEEEESPALLTSKLIPLVKQLRKGDVVMQALIATAGKETAVLISRRSISPARGKLLKDYLGDNPSLEKFLWSAPKSTGPKTRPAPSAKS